MLDADTLIEQLHLELLPGEGGYYRETWRAKHKVPAIGGAHQKSAGTAIYYLLTPDTFSAMHRLPSDEVYHFYLGDPVEMLLLRPTGKGEIVTLGSDLLAGQHLQLVVPRETWQGSRLVEGGKFALMGTTMAPGFDFSDFEAGDRETLCEQYPAFAKHIDRRTTHA